MSLRNRLLLAIGAALLASFLAGAALSAWQAARLVRIELSAELATGTQSVAGTLQDVGGQPTRAALMRLVASFNGSRHLLAALRAGGSEVARSVPAKATASPEWFVRLASPLLPPIDIDVGDGVALRLLPLPASEIAERWSEARRLILLLAFFSSLSAALCVTTADISLRPLKLLVRAFGDLQHGGGDRTTLPETGASEISALAISFNRMQEALHAAARANRLLSAQLARLAEEERVELARDLHDEMGPLLFAITAWAAAARMQEEAGQALLARASLASLETAAGDLQSAMRNLSRRLRDSAPEATDLVSSLCELVAFWREIQPATTFQVQTEQLTDTVPDAIRNALFRVAQEGISNAVRHGNPANVLVRACCRDDGLTLSIEDDGKSGPAGTGFGLIGMEERMQALGGTLQIERQPGWRVTAWAPLIAAASE